MQVSCTRCDARYEFEASSIPRGGYRAQCTHCGAEFDVGRAPQVHPRPPSLRHPPAAAPNASAFPEGMAETLAAEGRAWDHGQKRAENLGPSAAKQPRRPSLASLFGEDIHDGAAKTAEIGARGQRSPSSANTVADGHANDALSDVDAGDVSSEGHADDDKRSRTASLSTGRGAARVRKARRRAKGFWAHVTGRPDVGHPREERSRAKLGFVVGMVCVALVTLGVVVGVSRSKQLHLPTQVPPPLHIVREPPAAAVEAFERGLAALHHDNDAELGRAIEAFAAARALDEDYTDAWAGEALGRLLRSQGARNQLEASTEELEAAGSQLVQLAEAQGARAQVLLPDAAEEGDDDASATHQQQLHALETASASLKLRALARRGHDVERRLTGQLVATQSDATHAASLLLHAGQLLAQTPMLASVMALWYVEDEAARALVLPQLRVAEQLGAQAIEQPRRSWSDAPVPPPLAAPFASWRMLVRARLAAASGAATQGDAANDAVVAAYEAALRLDPQLRRARWELANHLLHKDRSEAALVHLRQLANEAPRHERAYVLWQQLVTTPQQAPAAP